MVFNAYGQRSRWIDMLQDFNFKILHSYVFKHLMQDTLSRSPIGRVKSDEDLLEEIQNIMMLKEMGIDALPSHGVKPT
jgi:hypothetical protein